MYDYTLLPEHMRESVRLYIEQGIQPGDFLYSVLCNDLSGAFFRADSWNREAMYNWARFLWDEIPGACWGSADKVRAWIQQGGEQGRLSKINAEVTER